MDDSIHILLICDGGLVLVCYSVLGALRGSVGDPVT